MRNNYIIQHESLVIHKTAETTKPKNYFAPFLHNSKARITPTQYTFLIAYFLSILLSPISGVLKNIMNFNLSTFTDISKIN